MAQVIFWVAFSVVAYVYAGYPVLLWMWRIFGKKPVSKQYMEPTVSVVIAMHNERQSVHSRLQNCFDLDYPPEKLQIIVALDAPTDGTDEVVDSYRARGVEVASSAVRKGKADALNRGMALAKGDIVVFADAKQRFARSAVREMVANFADDSIGVVSGELVLLEESGTESSAGVGLYWRYEKMLRRMESDISSVPGATGAIYAIRRDLFEPLPVGTILDDVLIPMRIVLGGKRAIFDPAARAFDSIRERPEDEYERKRRTLMGNYQLLAQIPQLLLPWRDPIFVQFVSHKVGRLVTPYFLCAMFVTNLFLLSGFYRFSFAAQVMWYAAALLGWRLSSRGETLPEPRGI